MATEEPENKNANKKRQKKTPSPLRSAFIAAGLAGALLLANNYYQEQNAPEEVGYSEFLERTESGEVDKVTIQGGMITGTFNDGSEFKTYTLDNPNLVETLRQNEVKFDSKPEPQPNIFVSLMFSLLPMALFIGFFIFVMPKLMGGGRGGALGMGNNKAKPIEQEKVDVTFDDVAGIDEAKVELKEIVDFLKKPERFEKVGGRIPRGALLVGPPGTGKTLTAKAVAGEAGVPFFKISGSEFVEMFVGVGASRVRNMFEQVRKVSPSILFIDEIDAVGRHRGAGLGGGNDEREQTLNQILVEMDGMDTTDGVIVIAATNRPDVLDPALMRPGRFDRRVVVGLPDVKGREQILNVHIKKIPIGEDIDTSILAKSTPGFSGADLANLVNEAALMAARVNKEIVNMQDFEAAIDKIIMGSERKSMMMSKEDKELTAYHEAGHALVGLYSPGNDPLHKVSIIPRGQALGVTMNLPQQDRYGYKKNEMEARMAMMFGGRVAEQIIYGEDNVTTGASNDIQQATDLARRMITEFGMSDKLGRVRYRENQEEVFLGHSVAKNQNISEHTAKIIDEEIKSLTDTAEKRALKVLNEHKDELHKLAAALLKYETLSGDQVQLVLNGKEKELDRQFSSANDNQDMKWPPKMPPAIKGP
jgi:cell division protease FtsH